MKPTWVYKLYPFTTYRHGILKKKGDYVGACIIFSKKKKKKLRDMDGFDSIIQ